MVKKEQLRRLAKIDSTLRDYNMGLITAEKLKSKLMKFRKDELAFALKAMVDLVKVLTGYSMEKLKKSRRIE